MHRARDDSSVKQGTSGFRTQAESKGEPQARRVANTAPAACLPACMEAEPGQPELEPSAKRHKHSDRKHKKHKHKDKSKHRAKGEYRDGEAGEPGSAEGPEQVLLWSLFPAVL